MLVSSVDMARVRARASARARARARARLRLRLRAGARARARARARIGGRVWANSTPSPDSNLRAVAGDRVGAQLMLLTVGADRLVRVRVH